MLLLAVRQLTCGKRRQKGPKKAHKAEASTLHELLHFVDDRVAGYQKAVEESLDPARRRYYQHLVSQSQQFAQALNEHLRRLSGGHEASTTLKGKLYRRFLATAAIFTGHDEQTVLATNIHGEQWALAAYKDALSAATLRGPIRQEVARQYRESQQTYQELKDLTT
ncbi:MAG: PA2169 family four-helix-bundle protein [Janthinobacterium lividum]